MGFGEDPGTLSTVKEPKRALLDAVRRGQARARELDGSARPLILHSEPQTDLSVLESELEQARALFDKPLAQRERARIQLTSLTRSGSAPLKAQAAEALRDLRAIEEKTFGPLRDALRQGRYGPSDLRRDVAARPTYEHDLFVDRLLGIHDPPKEEKISDLEQSPFLSSSLTDLWPVFDRLGPEDVFFDLGSGVGKVVFLVRWMTGARAIGVEYDPALGRAAEAARNALDIDVELLVADAREVDYRAGTFFYFFEPFRGSVLGAVLDKILEAARLRPIQLATRWVTDVPFEPAPWMIETDREGAVRFFFSGPASPL